jgi:hypothetical protein
VGFVNCLAGYDTTGLVSFGAFNTWLGVAERFFLKQRELHRLESQNSRHLVVTLKNELEENYNISSIMIIIRALA